ncbi:hypothetical protein CSUNSWCD_1620 [Campylobacter showae CSUNSWCD]|uniref:Uncharacterized protein n=1 Tax=Campylobacter showae CSUNSWCD TaxID=1244083 RepID=M5IGJ2_9BACT|nr:hypothetical protein CSUNSWCD_1620 [Campylobacter showae CSUNSWCD]
MRAINLSKFALAARRCLLFLFKILLRFLNQILVKASIQNLVKKSAKKRNLNKNTKFEKIYADLERLLQKANLNLTVFSTKKN